MSEAEGKGTGERRGSLAPPQLHDLVGAFASEPPDPTAGQIWRARWGSVAQVVLLAASEGDDFQMVPLTPDVNLVDDSAVVLPEATTPLGFAAAGWVGLRRRVPIRVLDVLLGSVDDAVLHEIVSGRGAGASISSAVDERAQVRDAIARRLSDLADATWLPEAIVNLEEEFHQRGLRPASVAREIGVEPGDIIDLIRGDRAPSPEVAQRLAGLLKVDPTTLTAVPVDGDLVKVLDLPKFRRRLAEKGRLQGVVDEVAWRYRVATQELATAARTTGPTDGVRRWLGLVEAYLR